MLFNLSYELIAIILQYAGHAEIIVLLLQSINNKFYRHMFIDYLKTSVISINFKYNLYGTSNNDLINIVKYCPNLKSIILSHNIKINDRPILKIAQYCKKIEEICVFNSHNITDKSISKLVESCKELKKVIFRGCYMISGFSLSEFKNLYYIDFSYCNITNNDLCKIIKASPNLTALYIDSNRNITGEVFYDLAGYCSNLEILSLSWLSVSDDALTEMIKTCPRLQEFRANECRCITYISLSNIAEYCCKLNTIRIENCGEIKDIFLYKLSEHCLGLESLYIESYWQFNITDNSLCKLVICCSKLEKLSIMGCKYITDMSICVTAKHGFTLKYVNFMNCKQITEQSIILFNKEKCSVLYGCIRQDQ